MKLFAIACAFILGASSFAGEFSKIDLVVRETLERHFINQNIDFFEDISNLQIEPSSANCDLIVSALVDIQSVSKTKNVCLIKTENGYLGSVL